MTDISAHTSKEKIKVLIITLGGERKRILEDMFGSQTFQDDFDVDFSPGIHQRELRNRVGVLKYAHLAGVLPQEEWDALEPVIMDESRVGSFDIGNILSNAGVKINEDRKGSDSEKKLYFAEELWRKAKTLARDRAVLACTFAHLIAMKRSIEEGFDIILEDNVRACRNLCGPKIKSIMKGVPSDHHLLYFGWLGNIKNLNWTINVHAPKSGGPTFPFPTNEHHMEDHDIYGTVLWGAYAYHIKKAGYDAIISALTLDVGGLLWKGKRMRAYVAKPVDKIMPRKVKNAGLRIEVAKSPCFFRAPMLKSRIHAKWDPEFCKSTEFQLEADSTEMPNGWDDVWLTDSERRVVERKVQIGLWQD